MPELSATSLERLKGVNPRMVAVVKEAVSRLPFDVLVTEGLRSRERQKQLYAQGRTVPGKVVTWTLNSKHCQQADGTGHAVDLCPVIGGSIPWNDRTKFVAISKAMFAAAEHLGTHIRWGADWDADGHPYEKGEYDGPHFELT